MFNNQYMFNMYWILNIIEHHWWSYLFSLSECCLDSAASPGVSDVCFFALFFFVFLRFAPSGIIHPRYPATRASLFIYKSKHFSEIKLILEKRATQMPVLLFSTPRCNLYDHESAGETSEIENNALYEPVQHRSHGYSPLPWFSWSFAMICLIPSESSQFW